MRIITIWFFIIHQQCMLPQSFIHAFSTKSHPPRSGITGDLSPFIIIYDLIPDLSIKKWIFNYFSINEKMIKILQNFKIEFIILTSNYENFLFQTSFTAFFFQMKNYMMTKKFSFIKISTSLILNSFFEYITINIWILYFLTKTRNGRQRAPGHCTE